MDVVFHGASLHAQDSCCAVRAYDNLEHRAQSQGAFYGSSDWPLGSRESIVALIDTPSELVLELEDLTLNGLRK